MSEKAGPKSPPVANRFQKGRTGNPKGRPRKEKREKSASAFDLVIDRTLTVTRGGVSREVTMEEALQHRTYQDAIAGNRPARREVLKMIAKREKALADRHKPEGMKVVRRIEPDPGNSNAALLILGIACRDPYWEDHDSQYKHLLLEPWAVQVALSRRRGGRRLTQKEMDDIERCTRDAGSIRWPRGAVE